jgi:carbon monoxide dehydrogenase subunit G
MAFEISKTFTIHASSGSVWAFLIDPQRVARCLPGAAVTEKIDDKTWAGTMTVKVGPVSSSYKGKVVFEKLDADARTAEIVATGMDVKGKGGADLRLTSSLIEKGARETEVTTVSKVNITGILAQMGRGMVQDVSDQMFKVFSERMRSELESAEPTAPSIPPVAAAPPPPAISAPAISAPPAARAEALDLGALGARVALKRPEFWVAVAVAVLVLYWLFR